MICEYQDYLNYQMTGELVASINNTSIRWHYRADKGGFPVDLLAALSIPELAEKWPSDVLGLGDAIGRLTPAAAGTSLLFVYAYLRLFDAGESF